MGSSLAPGFDKQVISRRGAQAGLLVCCRGSTALKPIRRGFGRQPGGGAMWARFAGIRSNLAGSRQREGRSRRTVSPYRGGQIPDAPMRTDPVAAIFSGVFGTGVTAPPNQPGVYLTWVPAAGAMACASGELAGAPGLSAFSARLVWINDVAPASRFPPKGAPAARITCRQAANTRTVQTIATTQRGGRPCADGGK